jgi:hypothetical protein
MSSTQDVQAAKAPVYYANHVAFTVQVYDFKLDFSLVDGPESPPTVVATVHLSPQLAKVVGRMLRRNVKAYEEQSGQRIHLPEAVLEKLEMKDLEE